LLKFQFLIHKVRVRVLNGWYLQYSFINLCKLIKGLFNLYIPTKPVSKSSISITINALNTIVISLSFREDRRDKFNHIFSHHFKYQYINGTHGATLDLEKLPNKWFSINSKKYLSKGSIGCILSHYQAWKKLYGSSWNYALILEDDAYLGVDISEIEQALLVMPSDFDIVFFGSSNIQLYRSRFIINNQFVEPVYPRRGLFAYIITRSAVSKINDNIFPVKITAGGIDTIIGKLILDSKLKAYHTINNRVIADRSSPSNIIDNYNLKKKIHFRDQ
jgi:GR25 family glycosyltransferase involved in LPS biosynthesis